ncbi:type IV secretory system conjugative DNA transfer family protein [Massilia sp. CFBP9012]|uniref:type IV secretory system conjugative DNA transfer family protein n=1 Tax=Massilia sp. CFBP9012 TaxID=3096531 RepID=UPI002A6998E3|nr:type IV secretory system conjugative DNA transfer family protein [Massilia sp. CFBP9012]MDY0977698.1 type IV secretory system conjugative DNA transfer family protein [Massilia sp. CFBP9012]
MLITPIDMPRYKALAFSGLLLTGVLIALYLASYFFLIKLSNPQLPPSAASPMTVIRYWQHYGTDPYTRHWLIGCLIAGSAAATAGVGCLIRPVSRSIHGDARFATLREVIRAGLFGDAGIILGRWGRRYLILGRQLAAIVIAPPRSGKGAGLVQPNALSWSGSLIVNDVRRECYRITAGYRSLFSKVYLFDPLSSKGVTAQWNPISTLYVPDDPPLRVSALQKIANQLSPDPAAGDPFWPASCRDLFLGLGLYVIETASLPRTLGEMVRQIMHGEDDSVSEHWRQIINDRDEAGQPLSSTCKRMLYDFVALSPQTQSSVRKTFTAKLQLWTNPLIDAATSEDSFDFHHLRRKRLSIYLGVNPGDLGRLSLLMNLFFTQMLDANMDTMPEDDPTIKYELLPIMDELAALGRMPIIENSIQLMGGYGIRPLLIAHSIPQLRSVYGPDHTKNIIACCGARVVYAPNDSDYATDISRELGTFTTDSISHSRPARGMESGTISKSKVARALLNPQEVRMMGINNEIVFIEHCPPIFCRKIWYWQRLVFLNRANRPRPEIIPIEITMPPSPILAKKAGEGAGKGKAARDITPKDVSTINKLKLTDFATNFSHVQLPKRGRPTDEDLRETFNSFITAIEA